MYRPWLGRKRDRQGRIIDAVVKIRDRLGRIIDAAERIRRCRGHPFVRGR
jgi:hypothetical protein